MIDLTELWIMNFKQGYFCTGLWRTLQNTPRSRKRCFYGLQIFFSFPPNSQGHLPQSDSLCFCMSCPLQRSWEIESRWKLRASVCCLGSWPLCGGGGSLVLRTALHCHLNCPLLPTAIWTPSFMLCLYLKIIIFFPSPQSVMNRGKRSRSGVRGLGFSHSFSSHVIPS